MADNILSNLRKSYQRTIGSPAQQALLLAAVGIPAMYLLKKPVFRIFKNLASDPRASMLLGMKPSELQEGVAEMENNWVGKHGLPIVLGVAPALASLLMNADYKAPWLGLNKWDPLEKRLGDRMPEWRALTKSQSLWEDMNYQPSFDFAKPVPADEVTDMLSRNPFLSAQPYQRNLGVSIVSAADNSGYQTTLGDIYDSAIDKFEKKLNRQGLAGKAIKGVMSGALAGMFTDVVGAVMGMPQPLRGRVANSVGVGKTLYDILT